MKSAKETPPTQPKIVVCPSCGGESIYAVSNPFRPFCSERCKNIDFGAWASESFRVPATSLPEDQRDGAEPLQ
ncbi:MAG TPA: DNA gyrase inhibitor YacG [Rhodoferax sp.]